MRFPWRIVIISLLAILLIFIGIVLLNYEHITTKIRICDEIYCDTSFPDPHWTFDFKINNTFKFYGSEYNKYKGYSENVVKSGTWKFIDKDNPERSGEWIVINFDGYTTINSGESLWAKYDRDNNKITWGGWELYRKSDIEPPSEEDLKRLEKVLEEVEEYLQ